MTTPTPTSSEILAAHIEQRNAWISTQFQTPAQAEPYLLVLEARAAAFAAHVASMDIAPEMTVWALAMARKYGSWVRAHFFIADWITALLIVRYGEEPDAEKSTDQRVDDDGVRIFQGWPRAFSDADLQRAQELLQGKNWSADLTLLARDAGLSTTETA